MPTVIVTKEIEVNVVKVPDYTEELNQIKEASIIAKNAIGSCEYKAHEMGKDILEQIGVYVSNLMQPILSKYTYREINGYFSTSPYAHSFYLELWTKNDDPCLIIKSAGTLDNCKLLMKFHSDGNYEIVRNIMDADLLARLVSEWPRLKDRLMTENQRFINNQKSQLEAEVKNMADAIEIINSFKL